MTAHPTRPADDLPRYEIRLRGRLDPRWATWFDDMTLTTADDGTTALRGPVTDQAALHGLLQKVCDLGLPLLSVTSLDADQPRDPQPDPPATLGRTTP